MLYAMVMRAADVGSDNEERQWRIYECVLDEFGMEGWLQHMDGMGGSALRR